MSNKLVNLFNEINKEWGLIRYFADLVPLTGLEPVTKRL